ncbi:MAG TPA: ABC transporter substrate-binding protein, partial [Candidatus Deferrimicrobium sp.]|nr:ABC transporter substrate-binding protein [Candidatus Deferrimicrobium sp.]
MPAFRPIRPAAPGPGPGARRSLLASLSFLAFAAPAVVAACAGAATPRPSIPADATGSLLPPATATAAASPTASAGPTFPLTLTGDEGTAVELKAEPRKIVSLTPATTEILFALGAGDRVVGKVEDLTPYPPEADAIPIVAKFGQVDVEKIVSLDADVVIAGGNSFNPPDKIAQLRKLGVPVLVVYAPDIAGVLRDVEVTGDAVGRSGEARDLTASMRAAFDQIEAAT